MAKDPSRFGGGDANLYAYAAGDTVNLVDWNGKATASDERLGTTVVGGELGLAMASALVQLVGYCLSSTHCAISSEITMRTSRMRRMVLLNANDSSSHRMPIAALSASNNRDGFAFKMRKQRWLGAWRSSEVMNGKGNRQTSIAS